MAVKKKTGLEKLGPIPQAAIGGAVGFGAARLAIFGGQKLAELPQAPDFVRQYNPGTILATLLGIGMAVAGKTPVVQSAGVGMVTTTMPEYWKMYQAMQAGENSGAAAAAMEARSAAADIPAMAPEPVDESGEDSPQFDVLASMAILEDDEN